jgi:DNA polymerase-3 subunit epsilon
VNAAERIVFLDTETTGLRVEEGHRVIELGCIELIGRRLSGRDLHLYFNPEREVDEGAAAVHGMRLSDLVDKPRFADEAERILAFLQGARVVIHNAAFDEGFLNAELAACQRPKLRTCVAEVVDSLSLARQLHPGKRNSLDALCERYEVSNKHRVHHGAKLDAQLLAEVWLAMTRGQESLEMGLDGGLSVAIAQGGVWPPAGLKILPASTEERAAHSTMLDGLDREAGGVSQWRLL